jgi:hypothetical protein
MDGTSDLKEKLVKLYGIWVLSDIILLILSLLYVSATGSLTNLLSALLIDWVFWLIPFPFDLLATWQIDPLSIIFQLLIFFAILIFLFWKNRED